MIYDNGWYRVSNTHNKIAHYFFNDKVLHTLKHGVLDDEIDCEKRYSYENSRKCKVCLNILETYQDLKNRCTTP